MYRYITPSGLPLECAFSHATRMKREDKRTFNSSYRRPHFYGTLSLEKRSRRLGLTHRDARLGLLLRVRLHTPRGGGPRGVRREAARELAGGGASGRGDASAAGRRRGARRRLEDASGRASGAPPERGPIPRAELQEAGLAPGGGVDARVQACAFLRGRARRAHLVRRARHHGAAHEGARLCGDGAAGAFAGARRRARAARPASRRTAWARPSRTGACARPRATRARPQAQPCTGAGARPARAKARRWRRGAPGAKPSPAPPRGRPPARRAAGAARRRAQREGSLERHAVGERVAPARRAVHPTSSAARRSEPSRRREIAADLTRAAESAARKKISVGAAAARLSMATRACAPPSRRRTRGARTRRGLDRRGARGGRGVSARARVARSERGGGLATAGRTTGRSFRFGQMRLFFRGAERFFETLEVPVLLAVERSMR